MAISKSGVTAIVLNTDPHAKARLSGAALAQTMGALCGAVECKASTPVAEKRRDHTPHM